ncbi:TPA: hypothetical protein DCE37_25355 [Candidatus Latescibacteria bacterium]|nr:hypothetical protein [Candidatus Latescibacterota bacterium]
MAPPGGGVQWGVDGECVESGPAKGNLLGEGEDLAIGHIARRAARFEGEIGVSAIARDVKWATRRYEELAQV